MSKPSALQPNPPVSKPLIGGFGMVVIVIVIALAVYFFVFKKKSKTEEEKPTATEQPSMVPMFTTPAP